MGARNWHSMYRQHRRFVLLDRDGVINRRPSSGYVGSWENFEFLPRALEALRLLNVANYSALVISNQSCVGKGLMSSLDLDSMTRRFLLEVALSGGHIAQVYYCRHRAEDHCNCRKPQPGMPLRARADHGFVPEETYFIGDSQDEMTAARTAGCPSLLIRREAFLDSSIQAGDAPPVASNLYQAVEMILAMQKSEAPEMAMVRV